MIISKYSGNIVGYVDYYSAARKRVNRYLSITPIVKVRRDGYFSDKAEYVDRAIRHSKSKVRQNPGTVLCTKLGDYEAWYEIGSIIDITV